LWELLLCGTLCDAGGYPGAHGAGMGGMGGLGNLGAIFQDPELLQAFQVYIQIFKKCQLPLAANNYHTTVLVVRVN